MMHVAYCFDPLYEQHFGASITSLLLNFKGPGSDLCVHVVVTDVSDALRDRLLRLTHTFRARIEVHLVLPEDLQRLSVLPVHSKWMSYLTMATYFRVLLPNILPPGIDWLLYLDSDTIVLSDVRPLFDIDLQGAAIGAVIDSANPRMAAQRRAQRYINSGVMLMDLQRWRQDGIVARCLDFALNNPEQIRFGDQSAINAVCTDVIHVLDDRWNRFVVAHNRSDEVADAAILHFITADKPWQSWYENNLSTFYWRYLDVSPWAGAEPVRPNTVTQAQRLARLRFQQGRTQESVDLYERIASSLTRTRPG